MRKIYEIIFISLFIFIAAYSMCFAAGDAKKNIKKANNLYQKGKIDEALQKYNDANVSLPDSDPRLRREVSIVNFNIGAALYKKEDYQKAVDSFTKALTSDDKKIEADALYNLGNCKYKLGKLKENTDLSAAAALLRESLDYYKMAVEIDQKNTDARFNHEFVERELKVLLDKLKQRTEDSDRRESRAKPRGEEKTEDKEDKEEEEQREQKQEQEEQSAAEESQEDGSPRFAGEAGEAGENKELSEEGAHALLERYGRDEATPDYMDRRARGYEREVLKDW